MSLRASPRLIGLFVLGALALLVAGVILLGGGALFSHGQIWTVYFDESLKGLRRGAPVAFRGVEIGQVTDIRAIYDEATRKVRVPVTVEIRPGAVALDEGATGSGPAMAGLIADGLRARLDLQSLLTGQLLIALDFFPPPVGASTESPPEGVIPSVPSTLASLQRTADNALMDLPEITRALKDVTVGLRGFLSDTNRVNLERALASLADAADVFGDPEGPAQSALAELTPLLKELRATTAEVPPVLRRIDGAAASGDALLRQLTEQTSELSQSLGRAAEQAANLIRENRGGLKDFVEEGLPEIQGFIDDATRLVNELSSTVRDIRQDPARFFLGDRAGQGVQLQ